MCPTGRAEFRDPADSLINAEAENFHRERVVEPVDDQAGEPVSLGVDHAVRIRLLVQPQSFDPEIHCLGNLVVPERGARGLLFAREDAQADLRTRVP